VAIVYSYSVSVFYWSVKSHVKVGTEPE